MTRHIHAFAALIMALAASAQPKAHFISTTHDFGAFGEDSGPAATTFHLVNTGDQPLVITSARANCGCTTPHFSTAPIAPGDTTEISVAYNPEGRPGRFEKRVIVDTNTEPERTTLTIKGVVIGSPATVAQRFPISAGPLALRNSSIMLGRLERGRIKNVFIDAYNTATDTVTPSFSDIPAWLEVKATPAAVPPGQQTSISLFVRSDKTPSYGLIADTLTLTAGDASLRIPTLINIVEDFSKLTDKQLAKAPAIKLSDSRLEFAELTPTATATRTFTITNTGKSPLIIHRIYTADRGFTIAAPAPETKIKPGKSVSVAVTADPSLLPATASAAPGHTYPMTARIIVISNDPQAPETPLRVTAPILP